jgi:hypothetical protein
MELQVPNTQQLEKTLSSAEMQLAVLLAQIAIKYSTPKK